MLTANNYKRKRPRYSSSQLVAPSMSNVAPENYLRKKQQQYSTVNASNPEVINLDSDAEDYALKDSDVLDDYFGFENNDISLLDDEDSDSGLLNRDAVRPRHSFSSYYNTNNLNIASLKLTGSSANNIAKTRKKRTKSLPQLPYSKLNYYPDFDKDSVREKIGDVKTTLIQHQFTNYTYGSSKPANRKFSFNTDVPSSMGSYHHSTNSSSDSYDSANTSATSIEDTPCDDKDGHYIIVPGAPFANDRYQIQSLLGQGTFGKVVKAHDRYNNCSVAIKIIRAIPKYREASKVELRVLTMLKKHDKDNVNQCIHLRECFDYRGHICIVTDILKISLYDFLERNQFLPFPGSHIQAIAKQLLRSVAFLHDLNLVHTDLKPENILLKDDTSVRKPYMKPSGTSSTMTYRNVLNDPRIYTIDFGSTVFEDEYHSSVVSTRHYRAPEIVLGIGWSFPCDMWSVGCILVELVTGDALFKTHENAQHLAMMEQVLREPVDLKLVRKCFSQFYYTSSSRRKSSTSSTECITNCFSKTTGKLLFPTAQTPIKLIDEVERLPCLSDLISSKVGMPFEMDLSLKDSISKFKIPKKQHDNYEFWYWFIDLLKGLLKFDPEKRITAMDALSHTWFNYGILDDGTLSL
ncbi:hypothetical protein OGAPHI_004161 [Ogataea philodendri]|uniref:Protein kinase domain-containing protein n=1 Tax=Ogataea philodendri TaxID=1378263 RepID=A0A9P8P657_9ASCO|nr:uncharacterized protein OGAPHI_004161 [Ogataea philodendri]KAH3665972.1 hypothetical protein OGAPHI_004161 [Ogataea philodendri]